ncbi:hypothetical protein B0H14DRAFT_2555696 [Mycena olivaceomarginata]|nr:hypothetical protein B0H14DRAFT_2555696 [Mycena olivaceomarginata]
MPGDDAEEMRGFISFFYDLRYLSALLNAADFTFHALGPSIRPSRLASSIRSAISSHLDCEIYGLLTSAAGWLRILADEAETELRSVQEPHFGSEPSWNDQTLELRRFPEPVSSIILARECNATSILSSAFLELLRGYADEERVLAIDLLSPEDSQRLLLARERIGKWFAECDGLRKQQTLPGCHSPHLVGVRQRRWPLWPCSADITPQLLELPTLHGRSVF